MARRQLLAAGVTRKALEVRLKRGRLLLVHSGVYAVGHRQLRREGYWMAAVLGAGEGAVLSHRDAAALHAILRPGAHRGVDVTTTAEAGARPGINVHRTTVLAVEDITTVSGIPTTSVARTLVDLAGTVSKDRLRKAMNEAERLHLLDVRAIEQTLSRTEGRHGVGHRAVRDALTELRATGVVFTRSELEDGWGPHSTRRAFQEDRERDARLQVAGYRVLRFTYRDVTKRPRWVASVVAELLASGTRATMSSPACP